VRPATDIADALAGFVAAEGCFTRAGRRFAFRVSVAAADAASVETLYEFLGVGSVHRSPRRRAHYDDVATYAVTAVGDLLRSIVPFMDEHLLPSHKREQYLRWRTGLLAYWEYDVSRPRPCSVPGCERVRRAKGLCRHHYYRHFGR
jgi:hypothetical protein